MTRIHDILLLTTDTERANNLTSIFSAGGYSSFTASSLLDAVDLVREGHEFSIVFIDHKFETEEQFIATRALKQHLPSLQVILIGTRSKVGSALRASNEGVFWLLSEPFENEELLYLVARGVVMYQLAKENCALKEAVKTPLLSDNVVKHSEAMQILISRLHKIAALDATVLLTGESGTGKTLLASVIHKNSPRKAQPFISLSCANFPRDLLESELFGHEKGAFTGATASRPGIIELCDGGTLFLDEIGELPLDLQPKLLTFLQDHNVRRIGGKTSKKVDVRIICATNQNLLESMKKGIFREDLFYRINVLTLTLPPLRDRPEDIPGLCAQILKKIATRRKNSHIWSLTPQALDMLFQHTWPGNIRELEHCLERATAFCESSELSAKDFDFAIVEKVNHLVANATSLVGMTARQVEELHLRETYRACKGDKEKMASMMGVSLKTVYNKLKNISPE